MELVSQFRCNGSDGYLAWLDNTLEIRDTANFDMEDINYDIRILDSPEKMQELLSKEIVPRIIEREFWLVTVGTGKKKESMIHPCMI